MGGGSRSERPGVRGERDEAECRVGLLGLDAVSAAEEDDILRATVADHNFGRMAVPAPGRRAWDDRLVPGGKRFC